MANLWGMNPPKSLNIVSHAVIYERLKMITDKATAAAYMKNIQNYLAFHVS